LQYSNGFTIDLQIRREGSSMREDCAVHAESTQSDGGHFYVIFLVAAQGPAFHSRYGNILSCLDFRAPSGDRENAGERRPRLAGKKDDLCFGGEDLKTHIRGQDTRGHAKSLFDWYEISLLAFLI
jgi:hypothetical protein